MKAIILAAGRGSRMGCLTSNQPKCMTQLHGKSLIDWQLRALIGASIDDIGIVRGYLAESFDFELMYFENERWSSTNMVVSLTCAKPWLSIDTCIISYSDIVYSSDAVNRLINAKGDIVIAYDPCWEELWSLRFDEPLSDAETFRMQGDQVIEIGQQAASIEEIEGQYMGLIKFTPNGWKQVEKFLAEFPQNELDKMDMTTLLQGLIGKGVIILGVAIQDKWFEVDSESDLLTYHSKYNDSPIK